MAPKSKRTPRLEFREPELPQPLRIVKQRGQIIAGCSAARAIQNRGRGISDGSEESRGSPPLSIDRPLTVHKRRGGRSSVLNGSFEDPDSPIVGNENTFAKLMEKNSERTFHVIEDPDLTPKAPKQVQRTMSAGAFLRSEFHSPRSRCPDNSSEDIRMSQLDAQGTQISPPNIPERRLSKSKTFFFKLAARKEAKPIQRVNSTTSKNTLIRRLSGRSSKTSSSDSHYSDSFPSLESSNSLTSMNPSDSKSSSEINNSLDIADVIVETRFPSKDHSSTQSLKTDCMQNRSISRPSSDEGPFLRSLSPGSLDSYSPLTRDEFILCPEIRITPEVMSLDAGSTNLWVAVEVTGVLRLANNHEQNPAELQEGRRTISGHNAARLRNFGRLQSMRIELITTRDASVVDVIGNLHESKVVYAGETHLILTKLRIAKVTKGTSHIRESSTSDEIMTDLETHLGGAVTSYLTVRLAYKHSGFLNYRRRAIDWEGGTSVHTTKLLTESSASIKRHNLESVWSPRASREMNGPLNINPLIKLIEMHLPSDKARAAIRRLAEDRVMIPMAKRLQNSSDAAGRSEDTVKLSSSTSVAASLDSSISVTGLPSQSSVLPSSHLDTQSPTSIFSPTAKPIVEMDPARKIWTEMRKNSRGCHNYRANITLGDCYNDPDDCSPSRLGSTDVVEEQRTKIKDTALRNKRSVGADTLKSFAPSVGKGKGGTVGGVGLGVGRWWVNSNWW